MRIGPKYGYFPNPAKCVLIVKDPQLKKEAEELFGQRKYPNAAEPNQ